MNTVAFNEAGDARQSAAGPGQAGNENKSPKGQKPDAKQRQGQESEETPPLWRSVFAETLGTFALTFVAAGGEVINAVSGGEISHAARAVAPALMVMALIYALGDSSGMHINPAVTLGFAVRGDFPWRRVPAYWLAQILGACGAALLLRACFGPVKHLGATLPQHGVMVSLTMEVVLTCFLAMVILGTATRYSLVGPNAALAVGGTIALCGLFAAPASGASMNPARSLGPALVSGHLSGAWIYVLGPFTGSLLGVGITCLLHTKHDPKEDEAAEGNGHS